LGGGGECGGEGRFLTEREREGAIGHTFREKKRFEPLNTLNPEEKRKELERSSGKGKKRKKRLTLKRKGGSGRERNWILAIRES